MPIPTQPQTMTRQQLREEILHLQGWKAVPWTVGEHSPRTFWNYERDGESLHLVAPSEAEAHKRAAKRLPDPTLDITAAIQLLPLPEEMPLRSGDGLTAPGWEIEAFNTSFRVVLAHRDRAASWWGQDRSLPLAICLAWFKWKTGIAVEISAETK